MRTREVKSGLVAMVLMAAAGTAIAQPFHEHIGTQGNERSYHVTSTTDRGYLVVGSSGAIGTEDFLIVKIRPDGTIQWSRTFGATVSNDVAFSAREIGVGKGYLIAGETTSPNNPNFNVAMLRLDNAGNFVWAYAYEGDSSAEEIVQKFSPAGVAMDLVPADTTAGADGSAWVVGRKRAGAPSNGQYGSLLKVRVDNGTPLVNGAMYDNSLTDRTRTRIGYTDVRYRAGGNGSIFITGTMDTGTSSGGAPNNDILFLRCNAVSGLVGVQMRYGVPPTATGFTQEYGHGLKPSNFSSDIFIAGYTDLANQSIGALQLLRVNLGGALVDSLAHLPNPASNRVIPAYHSLDENTWDSALIVGGRYDYSATASTDTAFMAQFRQDLTRVWSFTYNPPSGYESGESAIADPYSSRYVLASMLNTGGGWGFGNSDVHLVRTNSNGAFAALSPTCFDYKFPMTSPDPTMKADQIQTGVQQLSLDRLQFGTLLAPQLSYRRPCTGTAVSLSVADLNSDFAIDFGDFLEFFNAWDAQDVLADVNNDDEIDFGDFLDFFNAYDCQCE
jgi:hypothetical protein